MTRLLRNATLVLCFMAISAAALAQTTVTLQQGLNSYTGSTDAWLWSGAPDTNYGAADDWQMRFNTTTATLLRFAIFQSEGGPVPNGATITAATLSVYKYSGATSGTYNAQRLLRSWVESQATWNSASSGSPWQSGGAQGASDVTTTGEVQVTMGTELGWLNYDVLAIAQTWAGGAPNYGFRMRQVSGENQPHYFYAKDRVTQADLRPKLTITYTDSSCNSGTLRPYDSAPINGDPISIASSGTTTFEAEHFNCGGQGTAYNEDPAGDNNESSVFRTDEAVDITVAPSGYAVNHFDPGEWMVYTVNVLSAGAYDFAILASSNWTSAGTYRLYVDDNPVPGDITVPLTQGWDIYNWTPGQRINLSAGLHRIKIQSITSAYRIDRLGLTAVTVQGCNAGGLRPYDQPPVNGSPTVIQATGETKIQAEHFDCGGQNTAYYEDPAGENNPAVVYRTSEAVDITTTPNGYAVNHFDPGEWMVYTIDVTNTGDYDFSILASSDWSSEGKYRLYINDQLVQGDVTVPLTGNWDTYNWTPNKRIHLTASTQPQRLKIESVAAAQSTTGAFRIDELRLVPAQTQTACGTGTSNVAQADIRGRVQADATFASQPGYTVQVLGTSQSFSGIAESGITYATPLPNGETVRFGKVNDPANGQCKAFVAQLARSDPPDAKPPAAPNSEAQRSEIQFGTDVQYNKVYWVAVKVYVNDWGTLDGEGSLFGVQMHSGNTSLKLSPSFGIYTTDNATRFEIQARWGLVTNPVPNDTRRCSYANRPITDLHGHWTDFVFKFKHNTDGDGFLQVWMDGIQTVSHPGPAAMNCNVTGGAPGKLGFNTPGYDDYAKFGYYSWAGQNLNAARRVLLRSPVVVEDPTGNKYTAQDLRNLLNQ